MDVTQDQYLGRTVDALVAVRRQFTMAMQRHSPVMMQRQVTTIKKIQRIMSSTQVQHADESVDVPVAMHDRFMDEESAHDHVAGSWCSYEVNAATSRHVECPLPECRTLSDADTVSRSGGGALGTWSTTRRFFVESRCLSRLLSLREPRTRGPGKS